MDDAVTTLKEARFSWSEALGTLVAGYSTGDSVSALWNSGYRNAIGAADIINLMSNAGKMAVDPGVFSAIKAVGRLAYAGFNIGTAE